MTLAFSRPAVRPFATLLAALVLASSAAVAIAADTHAGKPIPSVMGGGADCREVSGTTTYWATFELGHNKGKWAHVKIQHKVGNGAWTNWKSESVVRVQNGHLEVPVTASAPSQEAWWELTFVNRKGIDVEGAVVSERHTTCS